jgi:predicted helicase/very-short-patch-repair endonuclease
MTLNEYIENISKRFSLGNSTEHTFRGDLQQLLESIIPDISATNEPKRIKCGSPDFVLMRKEIPVGFIEAKDVGIDLNHKSHKEQFDRYKSSLNNLIFTDYLDFHLYIDGKFIISVKIGEIINGVIVPLTENFAAFINLIKDFANRVSQTITSSKKLAEMMAGKARMLSDVIEKSLLSDESNSEDSTLKDQMTAFKDILIHDITEKDFADVYAQTIAYGMFAARLHDKNLDTFSRQEAAELIPKSNPFLRKLFGYIAGPDIDDRIKWIVDSLADIFRATDIVALLKNFGKSTQTFDPIIHFYETFLSEYDPKLRKARGVWYTPEPVVNFIVRAVDDILKTEFNLPQGLADTSKTKIKVKTQSKDARYAEGVKEVEKEVHRVQILDPATGTGTFLAEVIKQIHQKFKGQQGIWSNYVENNLIPRINGFELLMASYAMAHLKLDLLLTETGYKPSKTQRLHIYLTNSLEEHHPDTGTLFARWLSDEANEANHIKRDTPVMCVIGNPPYSVSSSNKSKWIEGLTADYKKDLNERNIQPLSDDYIKFIRFGQHFVEKNGEGILAYISNNSFIDGIIHRKMREELAKSFDKIYILDLHGNSKKKEVCPNGSPDQNVFDIMQGVSINIFVKTGKKNAKDLGKVLHFDSFGKREVKYNFLSENSLQTIDWNELELREPNFFLVKKDFDGEIKYKKGFKIDELFKVNSTGIKTHRDDFVIDFDKNNLEKRIAKFYNKDFSDQTITIELNLKNNRDWSIQNARREGEFEKSKMNQTAYRPFDKRPIYYDSNLIDFGREQVMNHLLKENISLIVPRQAITELFGFFIGNGMNDVNYTGTAGQFGAGLTFPLYLYPEANEQADMFAVAERTPNLNMEIVKQIADKLGLIFTPEKIKNTQPESSPPVLGGVDAFRGRGGNSQINNLPYLKTFRKELRNNLTPAEARFWKVIQNKQFEGRKFRRQHSVGNYILDFYCPAEKLAIELDGQVHFNDSAREYDYERKLFLEQFGIKVLRFENKRVFEDLEWMLDVIRNDFGWSEKAQPPRRSGTPPLEGGELLRENFAPIDILDYIYAVLHSPSYREKYKEFLKIDFPRVPYPQDAETFWKLGNLGGEIRQIHLLESAKVTEYMTQYPIDGDNIVGKVRFEAGKVWINETQYFDNVPEIAWQFYIGGYQPAQKWLKDRKERMLNFEDIFHYQKIIVALSETDRLMKEIDKIEFEK